MALDSPALILICSALFTVALLYGCVGQAGASGFVAVMALFGLAPETLKPTALVLNVLVSSVVAARFCRSGHFSWALLWPFLVASLPAAFIGGYLSLPVAAFSAALGTLLLLAGLPFLVRKPDHQARATPPSRPASATAGGSIGLLSGLTGMGGGVLLTPLLLYCQWATPRTATAVSAVFIFVNSAVALLGHLTASMRLPPGLAWMALAAVLGGALGAQLGSRHLPLQAVYRVLGITLVAAGARLLWT